MDTISSNSFANRMFASVVGIFLLLAIMFLVFQYQRETDYKVDILHNRLQVVNYQVEGVWPDTLVTLPEKDMRITVIGGDGTVLYDNERPVGEMANHRDRREVSQALERGQGYDIQRNSESLPGKYFYSATYFPERGIVVRSALPYSAQLYKDLTIDKSFIFFVIGITIVLCIVLFQIARRLSVSERQRVEGEKQQLKRQLTQNAAHELKTPTASISAYLETLLSDEKMSDEQRRHFLERSYAQCCRMTNILSDMSALARMDAVQQVSAPVRIRVRELLDSVLEDVRPALDEAAMTIRLNVGDTVVMGDHSLVYSIFRNLIENSIAYAGTGCNINVYAGKISDETVELFVSDNGVGVPSHHLSHLCERFYRIDKGRSRRLGGTGLGLAIVKNAVLLHGGEIELLTTPPTGLTVRFTLPTA